jgi:hypothetical protein
MAIGRRAVGHPRKKKGLRKETPLSAPRGAADTPDKPGAASTNANLGPKDQKIKVTAISEAMPARA